MQNLTGFIVFTALAVVLCFLSLVADRRRVLKSFKNDTPQIQNTSALDKYIRYDARFLAYALYFVLFCVVGAILSAFGIVCVKFGLIGFIIGAVFAFNLLCALIFAARKNILKWR